jgi:type VI secretion system secreted protein VgrG
MSNPLDIVKEVQAAASGLGALKDLAHDVLSRLPFAGTSFDFVAPPGRQGRLRVVSFSGREAISELFSLEVVLSTPVAGEPLSQDLEERLLCQPAYLLMHGAGRPARVVYGIVASFALEGSSPENGRPCARVRIVPRLWLATQRKQSRIFQDKTVREVVDVVLAEWKIPHTWNVVEEFAPRTYCTQYHETDYEFVARLLAEEGIFFYFTPPKEVVEGVASVGGAVDTDEAQGLSEELVLCDHEAYPPISAGSGLLQGFTGRTKAARPALYFRSQEHGIADEEQAVLEFALHRVVRPNAALLSGYDSRNPAYKPRGGAALSSPKKERVAPGALLVPAPVPEGALEVYTHQPRAKYESVPEKSQVDGRAARKALEQLRRDAYVGEGESRVFPLAPGHAFRLGGHPLDRLDHEYVVTEVEHSGRVPAMVREAKEAYRNHFRCVPAEVRYRPPVPPRRMVQVAETATVVGPGVEEIHTDPLGRIRVRFHWDLGEAPEGTSSCWMRVAQPWAGAGWGYQFIPRVGSEVLVTFLRGDPDAPLATGSVYNGANPTAFVLPESKSRSGIRTASTPGGAGYNELSFEDAAGMEQVRLHAQRDYAAHVGHDHLVEVVNDRTLTVGGVLREHAAIRCETVVGAKTSTVVGPRTDTVVGDHTVVVTNAKSEKVGGSESRRVEQAQTLSVGGGRSLWVDGALSTSVGTEMEPSEAITSVFGEHTTFATRRIQLTSEKEIVLQCGKSRVVIGPEEVRIETKRLVMSAEKSALLEADGPAIELTTELEMKGQALKLYSQGASLELTAKADLNGAQVNLNCGGGAASIVSPDGTPVKTRPVKLHLHDDDMQPFANKKYRLVVGDLKLEGTTDDQGGLSETVPADAKVGQLTLWVDEYPTGPRVNWPVELSDDEALPATEVEGALTRLAQLGYYGGEAEASLTPEAVGAIRLFQEDSGLPVTGELDAATTGKLAEVQSS